MVDVNATTDPCCAPGRQASCCEPSAKADCCGHAERCGCDAGSAAVQPSKESRSELLRDGRGRLRLRASSGRP